MAISNRFQPDPFKPIRSEEIISRGKEVVRMEAAALSSLEKAIDKTFAKACRVILERRRQIVVTGMGKSGHIARKIAATFAATGTPAIFVHPGEASHGDLGMLVEGDVLLVISNSGNTPELRAILRFARKAGIPIIGMASRKESLLIEQADVPLLLPFVPEACSANLAPTTSTTMQLALGDALAMTVMDMRGVSKKHLHSLHPAGFIGLSLTPVRDIMHSDARLPLIEKLAQMPEVISTMTAGCFGLVGVIGDEGLLIGIITDGDLRRHFEILTTALAFDVMSTQPKVISAHTPAGEALAFLNKNKITAAFVVEDPANGPQPPLGIVHIHDLLRHGLS